MGKNTKRPKSYYINNAKRRKNELTSNMKGFLCTTNMREKECVKEAYNILNEFAKKLYGSKNLSPNSEEKNCESTSVVHNKSVDEDEESEEDIETALKSEVAALKCQNSSSSEQRLFQQVFVRVNNCIFISANISDPVELSISIMDSIIDSKMTITKHLVKLLPVQKTCRAFSDDIIKTTRELVLERFPKHKLRFYVAYKTRNNNSLDREFILKSLSNIIVDWNIEAVPDFKEPDIVLNVDIVKNICCLGLLPKFMTKYCKYNLIKLAEDINKKEDCKIDIIESEQCKTKTENSCKIDIIESEQCKTETENSSLRE
ncbi:UNVERIFIED_CONTAM: hypothetical protein RMT77_001676 [Armadillidium vulgare]